MNQMMNMHIGYAFSGVIVKPGETKDLGDLKLKIGKPDEDDKEGFRAEKKSAKKTSPVSLTKTKVVDNVAAKSDDATTIRATVTLPDGSPAIDTHVALTAVSSDYSGSIVLGSGITNGNGTCKLKYNDPGGTAKSITMLLVARKDGLAIGWKMLDQSKSVGNEPFKIGLNKQGIIKGQLVDTEGKPAAGEKLHVRGIMDPHAKTGSTDRYAGFRMTDEQTAPRAWIQPLTTDKEGRFKLIGIPESFGVLVTLSGSEKFAPQGISLNTGMSEKRGPRDGTYRSLVKNVGPDEEAVLTLSPAKIITGTITYEDTNEPVPNAKISIWASQQEYGSMSSIEGKTDADGKYRMIPKPGIRFGVSAFPPSGVPYMGRETERIKWENADATRTVDIQLPRVTLVKGRVIEKGTGKPVSDATITFESSGRNAPKNAVTGWQATRKTGPDGKFTYAVSAGLGTLVVRKKDSNYVLQTMDSRQMTRGQPGGTRFYANAFHRVDVEKDTDSLDVEIEVLPGKTISGVIVDEEGKSIEEAIVITRLKSWDLGGGWRGDSRPTTGGKFELTGLESGESYKVHFLDAKRKLGATIELNSTDEDIKVVLKPCGSAKATYIAENEDDRDKLIRMKRPLLSFVLLPGVAKLDFDARSAGKVAADEDNNANLDRINYESFDKEIRPKLDDKLSITYSALIPGATYRIQTTFDQSWGYKEFVAKSGVTLDLGEITPRFDE